MTLPRVALTVGDPAGIGPEIAVRAALAPSVLEVCAPVVVGNAACVAAALAVTGCRADVVAEGSPGPDRLVLCDVGVDTSEVIAGRVQAAAGALAWAALQHATELARSGGVDAIATAPLNKESLVAAGVPYIDHTSALAALTGSSDVLTLFVVDRLRIVFATRHMSLRAACDGLSIAGLARTITTADAWLRQHGLAAPRFGVAALNPHAGEGGLFGDEELRVIAPAIEQVRATGVSVEGPVAADSVFHLCLQGRYDVVVAMYHDQGHIAAKTYDFERTVAVTTGLPFIRTSVDHGTAFDIAGQGVASPVSMIEAVRVAAAFAGGRGL